MENDELIKHLQERAHRAEQWALGYKQERDELRGLLVPFAKMVQYFDDELDHRNPAETDISPFDPNTATYQDCINARNALNKHAG